MAIYQPHSVNIDFDGLGAAVVVPDILELTSPTEAEVRREATGANARVKHAAIVSVSSRPSFRTRALEAVFGVIGPEGAKVASAVDVGVQFVWQKNDDAGTVASGSVHRTETYSNGFIYPTQLSVGGNREDAELTIEMAPTFDGTNAIKIISDVAALPTIAVAEAKWTLGPAKVGGNTLTDYTGLQIDFGANVETDSSESDVYDTHVRSKTFMPTITLTGIDPTWFGTIPLAGDVMLNATDYIYLRKRAQDENHFDTGSNHIKIALAGIVTHENTSFQATRSGETSLKIEPCEDSGGNAPIVITTGQALP